MLNKECTMKWNSMSYWSLPHSFLFSSLIFFFYKMKKVKWLTYLPFINAIPINPPPLSNRSWWWTKRRARKIRYSTQGNESHYEEQVSKMGYLTNNILAKVERNFGFLIRTRISCLMIGSSRNRGLKARCFPNIRE